MSHAFAPRRRTNIRWDRVGRFALLGTLFVILLLYLSPFTKWLTQSSTDRHQHAELQGLQQENRELKRRARILKSPGALEAEARKLGMVRNGERSYVIENLPGD